jgi:hypothetical protein
VLIDHFSFFAGSFFLREASLLSPCLEQRSLLLANLCYFPSLDTVTMGSLVWNDWARFVSITASICAPFPFQLCVGNDLTQLTDAVWSAFFGIIFRKFFWDFVGGTMRDPGGFQ